MSKKRILIIDDEANVTRLVKRSLEQTGHYTVCAENDARHAVTVALEFKPDLILLDVVMPEIDGGDVAARLQGEPDLKQIPIVFLTAVVSKKEGTAGKLISGGLRFIAKPVNLATLVRSIEEALGASQPGDEVSSSV
jgi:two-component system, OmpR family, response regulator